jgi:hypothetical protein
MSGSQHIEELETEDKLCLQRWSFWLTTDNVIRLDEYSLLERPTRRHKYKEKKSWHSTMRRQDGEKPIVMQYMISNALAFYRAKLRWEDG